MVRNDAITIDGIKSMAPDRIVLSPGPGRPDDPSRIGVCGAILDELGDEIPTLGVCLGHQAMVCREGGRVISAPRLMHGKTSLIEHDGDSILRDLPRPFPAMRYHSLVVDPAQIPDSFAVTARCKDGTVMAVRHRRKPMFGVQFHPESIGTAASGPLLCKSFLREDWRPQ